MTEEDTEEDEERPSPRPDGHGKKNGKGKEPPAPDKSTPGPEDPAMVSWIARLFRDDECVTKLIIKQLLGRDGKMEGSVIHTVLFPMGGKCPPHEWLVSRSNEIVEAMQNEADSHRKPRMFVIEAINVKAGVGCIANRAKTVEPKKLKLGANGIGAGSGDGEYDEDDPLHAHGGDRLLRRTDQILADGRWHSEQQSATFGGFAQILTDENKELRGMVKDLMGGWMAMAKAKNEAENNHLDRELARKKAEFELSIKQQGANLLTGWLIPKAGEIATQVLENKKTEPTNGETREHGAGAKTQVAAQGHPSIASLNHVMASLTNEEKLKIFGAWTEEGTLIQPGILTETQVRIIVGVYREHLNPNMLASLTAGQANQVTTEQQMAIAGAVPMEKLRSLREALNNTTNKNGA